MSDGFKQIQSPFTGCKKRKLGKRLQKNMSLKRRQNLGETDRWSYYKMDQLQWFLDSKGAFYNGNDSGNDNENYNENNQQQQLLEGFGK